jgi:prevent-host-death family protein
MDKVGMYELRQRFSELVRRAGRGEIIGITKRGKFVAILRPPAEGEMDTSEGSAKEIRAHSKKPGR